MKTRTATDEQTASAADAVVELALLSLEPSALRWESPINMAATQLAWNAGCPGEPPLDFDDFPGDRLLRRLIEKLLHKRKTRWPDLRCMVFDLEVRTADQEIVFSFFLSWDGGQHGRPCEMTVDWPTEPQSPD